MASYRRSQPVILVVTKHSAAKPGSCVISAWSPPTARSASRPGHGGSAMAGRRHRSGVGCSPRRRPAVASSSSSSCTPTRPSSGQSTRCATECRCGRGEGRRTQRQRRPRWPASRSVGRWRRGGPGAPSSSGEGWPGARSQRAGRRAPMTWLWCAPTLPPPPPLPPLPPPPCPLGRRRLALAHCAAQPAFDVAVL